MRWAARLGLTYHAITDRWDDELALPPASFEAQLRRIARAGYRGVTFSTFAAEPSSRGVVAITFDDAFSSVYDHAAPVLEELGWPATVFVTTGAVERDEAMRWLVDADQAEPQDPRELQPMTWKQIESLAERGWEIGSHSVSHPLLSALSATDRREELVVSRDLVTEHSGSCVSVSYPWGEVNDVVAEAARQAGYTVGGGLSGRFYARDPMRVPRFAVARRDDGLRIALKTSAPVWAARRSPFWTALSLRHRAAGPERQSMTEGLAALVLDGGSGQSLAIARRLGATGWGIVTEAGSRTARSRFTKSDVAVPSTQDGPAYLNALEAICAEHAIDLVVPTNDLTLELCWAASRRLGGARIFGGDQRAAETFLDKAAGIAAAERHGFPVPRTLIPATLELVGDAAAEIGFPCVVKPRRSFVTSSTGTRHLRHVVVSTPKQAEAAAPSLCDADGAPPIVQAFVEGRAVAATFVMRDGRTLARAVRETLSFWPVTGGTSVWKRSLPLDTPGVAEAERFLLAFGFEGLAEIEYQLDGEDVPRLMEVGPRAHGWIPLAEASCPGLIETAAAVAVGREARELHDYRPGIEMRWLRGELARVHFGLMPSGELPPAMSRGSVVRKAWPPWKPGMRYDIVDLGDPLPWVPRPLARLVRRR